MAINEAMEEESSTIAYDMKCQKEGCSLPMLTKRFCGGCKKAIHDCCNFAEQGGGEDILESVDNTETYYCCSAPCLRKILGIAEPPVPLTEPEATPTNNGNSGQAGAVPPNPVDVAITPAEIEEIAEDVREDE